jgi:acetolactate synthase-1/2/3 large subunit
MVSHIWDRGAVEQVIPQYVGVTNAELNQAMAMLAKADVVATFGARIDYRIGHGRPPALAENVRLIRVDPEPSEISRTRIADVGIAGDVRAVLEQMVQEARRIGGWSNAGWLKSVRGRRDRLIQACERAGRGDQWPLAGMRICREIRPFLAENITFLIDGGNIGRWAHLALFDRHPSHWFTCGRSGAVGWGLPAAVALKLSRPGHPLLLLSGDGAAGFTVSEIETALRFGTHYVAVIAHDAAWGIVAEGQPEGRQAACRLGEIRFDRVAQALGARGVYIERPDQIGPAIREGLYTDTVTVVHVPTQLAGISRWQGCLDGSPVD